MSLNATLIVEIIAFLLFIYSFKRFLWQPILGAMDARDIKIADGLAAADRGRKDLESARERASEIIREAREKATQIVDHASQRADKIVDEARGQAVEEREQQVQMAKTEIAQESNRVRESLRRDLSSVAIDAARKILQREIDPRAHQTLIDEFAAEI
ncbi:MAG: F0F1 ATP synthase subunit B [Burkholderiales bacterium]